MNLITKENHKNWFDNICAESRSKFIANELESKVHGQLSDELISKNECYSLITEKIKRSKIEGEDIMWKIPIILLFLGCLLVVLMAFSVLCHCLVITLKNSRAFDIFESEVCNVKEEAKVVKPSPSPKAAPKRKAKCCSCLNSN